MPQLNGILATESASAILIRNGPHKLSCTIGWDRRTDEFQTGQWLKKLMDYELADLSPDGKWFTYFIVNHLARRKYGAYRAISKAPCLKAMTFWGTSAYILGPGSGIFVEDQGVLRLRASDAMSEWNLAGIKTIDQFPAERPWLDTPRLTLFHDRLQRDGWLAINPDGTRMTPDQGITQSNPWRDTLGVILEKGITNGWKLRQITRSNGRGKDQLQNRRWRYQLYQLIDPSGATTEMPDWDWADYDPIKKRLVWTSDLRLWAASVSQDGPGDTTELLDTREMRFTRITAPY